MRIKRSVVAAALVAAAAAGWIWSGNIGESREAPGDGNVAATAQAQETLPSVRVRALRAEEHVRDLVITGRTEAVREVDVKAETTGTIVAVPVRKGQRVAKGAVLAQIAMDDRKARLTEAAALVDQRRIAYQAAEKLSEKNFRSAVTLAQNKADLEAARAALENITLDIERCTIRAPFSGVIDDLPAEQGYFVNIGGSVARVVDVDPVLVVGQVSERHVGELRLGDLAEVRLVTGAEIGGTVRFVSRTANPATRTFRVEIEVDNPEGAIVEGMTATLRLTLGRVMAHRVTPAVLTLSDDGVLGIKAVDAEGIVRFHPASLVSEGQDGVWLGDLPETLNLITVGQEFVRTGQRVRPVPEAAIEGTAG